MTISIVLQKTNLVIADKDPSSDLVCLSTIIDEQAGPVKCLVLTGFQAKGDKEPPEIMLGLVPRANADKITIEEKLKHMALPPPQGLTSLFMDPRPGRQGIDDMEIVALPCARHNSKTVIGALKSFESAGLIGEKTFQQAISMERAIFQDKVVGQHQRLRIQTLGRRFGRNLDPERMEL